MRKQLLPLASRLGEAAETAGVWEQGRGQQVQGPRGRQTRRSLGLVWPSAALCPAPNMVLAEGPLGFRFPFCNMGLSTYVRGILWEQRMYAALASTCLQLVISISAFILQMGVG